MNFLEVNHLSKTINNLEAINNVSFTQNYLQRLAIVGTTGSGKTTLLKMIAGLVQPTNGDIYFEDSKIIGPQDQLIPGNKGIAYVSQHFELLNNYVVKDLLQMTSLYTESQQLQVYNICKITQVLDRKTNELSGGERQRVALAKQILTAPKLLLLDEPFSNLDALHKQQIKQVLEALIAALNLTCILISHDANDVLSWADRIIVLQNGKIIQDNITKTVYNQPVNAYAAALLGDYFELDTTLNEFNNVALAKSKNLLCRPEQLFLSKLPTNYIATITAIHYFGGNYLVKAGFNNQTVLLRVNIQEKLTIGQEICIGFVEN